MNRREFLAAGSAAVLAGCAMQQPVKRRHGMVASSQRLASEAGASILKRGGNAADAAVAVAAALNVTEPTSTGLGGDMFAMYYDAATKKITALNGSGRAPMALTLERLTKEGVNPLPRFHGHAVTVPGACAGWCDLITRHGSLPLKDLFAPAIRIAEEGFQVGGVTAWAWAKQEKQLEKTGGAAFLPAPKAGATFRNPGLAKSLREIAKGGKDAYYRGEIGRAVVMAVAKGGGAITMDDLAAHESTWDEPMSTDYRGVRVWECPPNGQGIVALMALNILEGFTLKGRDPLGPERFHLLIEALRIAFADGRQYVADPRKSRVPISGMLSKEYAAERRQLIHATKASEVEPGMPRTGSDTVYFCVVDGAGNACSFINSNYMGFGTCLVPEGWGFTLQNRGFCFEMTPGHANALAPGKRPYHTIIPAMMTRPDGSLIAPFGVMGGFMQPQGHVQVVVNLVDDGVSPQEALDRPRFCVEVDSEEPTLLLEEGVPAATVEALEASGFGVKAGTKGFDRSYLGRGQIIRPRADGTMEGGSDNRAEGCAVEVEL